MWKNGSVNGSQQIGKIFAGVVFKITRKMGKMFNKRCNMFWIKHFSSFDKFFKKIRFSYLLNWQVPRCLCLPQTAENKQIIVDVAKQPSHCCLSDTNLYKFIWKISNFFVLAQHTRTIVHRDWLQLWHNSVPREGIKPREHKRTLTNRFLSIVVRTSVLVHFYNREDCDTLEMRVLWFFQGRKER